MAAKTQVDWQVLLEDEAWDSVQTKTRAGENAPAGSLSGRTFRSALQWALPFLLLLLVAIAFLRNVGVAGEQDGRPKSAPNSAVNADSLAAQARRVTLTEHLRIHATGPDVAVVAVSAAEMEALYVDTFSALGLTTSHGDGAPDGHLLIIVQNGSGVEWDGASGQVRLPSLAYFPVNGEWKQSELLRQSWVLALTDRSVREAGDAYRVPPGWLPLLRGMRLWLLWDAGGPLAEGHKALVARLYTGDNSYLSPAVVAKICRIYAQWDRFPLDYSIPMGCTPANPVLLPALPVRVDLATLGLPKAQGSVAQELSFTAMDRARTVVLALFSEYAVERYGRETIPLLLVALKTHYSWESLIPAVFDVSVEEFQAGWWVYLADEYGVETKNFVP